MDLFVCVFFVVFVFFSPLMVCILTASGDFACERQAGIQTEVSGGSEHGQLTFLEMLRVFHGHS